MTDIRVVVFRVDADAVDEEHGPNARRIRDALPWLGDREWRAIVERLPSERLRTRVEIAADAWPSASDYMEATANAPEIRLLLGRAGADGWIHRAADWAEAEATDAARPVPLLRWTRPLVRIGSLALIDAVVGEDAERRILADMRGWIAARTLESTLVAAPGHVADMEDRMRLAVRPVAETPVDVGPNGRGDGNDERKGEDDDR